MCIPNNIQSSIDSLHISGTERVCILVCSQQERLKDHLAHFARSLKVVIATDAVRKLCQGKEIDPS